MPCTYYYPSKAKNSLQLFIEWQIWLNVWARHVIAELGFEPQNLESGVKWINRFITTPHIASCLIYSASQNKETENYRWFIIFHIWYIFVKLRSSSFILCNSYDANFTHEWVKTIWRESTNKLFGGRYLNFKGKITFLESLFPTLAWHLNKENEPGIWMFC